MRSLKRTVSSFVLINISHKKWFTDNVTDKVNTMIDNWARSRVTTGCCKRDKAVIFQLKVFPHYFEYFSFLKGNQFFSQKNCNVGEFRAFVTTFARAETQQRFCLP